MGAIHRRRDRKIRDDFQKHGITKTAFLTFSHSDMSIFVAKNKVYTFVNHKNSNFKNVKKWR